jgi:hypothetical protein
MDSDVIEAAERLTPPSLCHLISEIYGRLGALSLLSADAARNGDHADGSIRLHLSIEPVLAATGEAAHSSHRISITPKFLDWDCVAASASSHSFSAAFEDRERLGGLA